MDIDNYIRTYFEGIDTSLTKTTKVATAALEALANKNKFIAEWSDKFRINTGRLSQAMANQGLVFDKAGNVVDKAGRKVDNVGKVIRKGIVSTTRFRMELLGVMFAGMALDRTFGGLVRSQLELFGVNEMFGAMITTVLLPVIEPLAEILFGIMEWFMDLPEPIQKVIGVFVLLAAGAGMLMMILGQFGLGFTSLITTIQKFALFIGNIFTGISATVLAVVGIIIAIILGMIFAWKDNFLGFRKWWEMFINGITEVFMGIVNVFKGIWSIIVGIFTLNWDKIKEGFGKLGEGIKGIFKGAFDIVRGLVISVGIGILQALKWTFGQVIRLAQTIWNLMPGHGKVTWYESWMALGTEKIPTFQMGGIMPYTGLAHLEKGERITPANESIYSPTINVYASISSDYDVRKLASELSRYWMSDLNRYSKIRG